MKGKAIEATMQWSFFKSLSSLLLAIVAIASVNVLIPVQPIILQSLNQSTPGIKISKKQMSC